MDASVTNMEGYPVSPGSFKAASRDSEEFYRHLWEEQVEVNARKDKFLALLSHELRNPLAPLLTAMNLLQRQSLKEADQLNALRIVERQARQLAHLIDDVFEVSPFTAGKIVLRKELLDVRVVVERAIESSRPLMEERGHDLPNERESRRRCCCRGLACPPLVRHMTTNIWKIVEGIKALDNLTAEEKSLMEVGHGGREAHAGHGHAHGGGGSGEDEHPHEVESGTE